jgi:hypothetical protein
MISEGSGKIWIVLLYCYFIIEMAVILMNLMIGLAISNIQVRLQIALKIDSTSPYFS